MGPVLFVCTANICRSPMAEGLLRARLPQVEARSAGVAAAAGQPATPEAITAAAELGADVSAHRSRPADRDLVQAASLVLTMTADQAAWLQARFPEEADKIISLGQLAQGARGPDVADPIGGPLELYRRTALQIQALLSQARDKILQRWQESK